MVTINDVRFRQCIKMINTKDLTGMDMLNCLYTISRMPSEELLDSMFEEFEKATNQVTKISKKDKSEIRRIFKLKRLIEKSTLNPIISDNPLIIDYNSYLRFKDYQNNLFLERGCYKIVKVINNILIIQGKVNKEKKIRLIFEDKMDDIAKVGDLLDLVITRKLFMVYWDIIKINKCIPGSML